jgi:hypothetical protein
MLIAGRGIVVATIVAGCATIAAASALTRTAPSAKAECPLAKPARTRASISTVVEQAERLVPSYFQGSATRPMVIEEVVDLELNPRYFPGSGRLRRRLSEACGADVGTRSWALVVIFPHRDIATSVRVVYLGVVHRRWAAYGVPRS